MTFLSGKRILARHGWWLLREREHKARISPLVLRILAVNVMALAILVGSLLYLGRYQDRLISAELDALFMQAHLSASAISEGAVVIEADETSILSPLLGRLMTRRLSEPVKSSRIRLYDVDQTLLADSRILLERAGVVESEELPEMERYNWLVEVIMKGFDLLDHFSERNSYPPYSEQMKKRETPYEVVEKALQGESTSQVWTMQPNGLMLAVAVPVQRTKQILGVVMISRPDTKVDAAIRAVRLDILTIFTITLFITILLSLYLARAIARPVRQLAMAADLVRSGQMKNDSRMGIARLLDPNLIPDLRYRQDEIGDLSGALRDMTQALAQRVRAIENFAADVAHEIKNPLTSLRSAVETAGMVKDPVQLAKLMQILRDDVDRMDRLISDISNASRLDAELSRAETVPIRLDVMLAMLIDLYQQSDPDQPKVVLKTPPAAITIMGVEVRLVQVMQNLIANALSFSPSAGHVWLSALAEGRTAILMVEDEGPGIPENKLTAIFDRFYSERPKAEKFGQHSGLGLSISRQIIEAHHGTLHAENRRDEAGIITGARFVIRLPLVNG